MKIAVIGYSGAGKSTLAAKLGKKLQLPVLHLDKIQFTPNWQERNQKEAETMVLSFMQENKDWVIDGNYRKFLRETRLKEADFIIFLNFPAHICLYQAFTRFLKNRNRTRSDMAEGCIEKFDFEFFKWVILDGRTKQRKAAYQAICNRYPEKMMICRNRKETENCFRRLTS